MAGGRQDGLRWARVDADPGGGIGALAVQRLRRDGELRTVERVASYVTGQRRRPGPGEAADVLRAAQDLGFDQLLAGHRTAWAGRWEAVDVRIPDDPAAQLALRFALFQLWCNTRSGELAVGARGLSGTGYAGHVFWDADVFVPARRGEHRPGGRRCDDPLPRAAARGGAGPGPGRSAGGGPASRGSPRPAARMSRRPACVSAGASCPS